MQRSLDRLEWPNWLDNRAIYSSNFKLHTSTIAYINYWCYLAFATEIKSILHCMTQSRWPCHENKALFKINYTMDLCLGWHYGVHIIPDFTVWWLILKGACMVRSTWGTGHSTFDLPLGLTRLRFFFIRRRQFEHGCKKWLRTNFSRPLYNFSCTSIWIIWTKAEIVYHVVVKINELIYC